MILKPLNKITKPQLNYIKCLTIDLRFDRTQRNAHISEHLKRRIEFLDELSLLEAQKIISYFISLKDNMK